MTFKILVQQPNQPIEIREYASLDSSTIKEIIGGNIEPIQLGNGIILAVAQSSLNGSDINFMVQGMELHAQQNIFGTAVFCKRKNHEYLGLDDLELEAIPLAFQAVTATGPSGEEIKVFLADAFYTLMGLRW